MFKGGNSCKSRCIECQTFRLGFARASHDIDAVVGVSRYILDKMVSENLFSQSQHRVIYNAQPAPKATPASAARPMRFGCIGALAPHKGVRWLIEQFDNSLGELLIAGSGQNDYVSELKALAAGKRITFVGYQPSSQFLPTIDVGIIPSIWNETLAGTAIECLANGRPAIASNRGGTPEIVRDGENGLLVDPDQPDSLGDAMARLSQDRLLQARLAAAAPASVGRFTDVERFLDEYLALYEHLLGQPASQTPDQSIAPACDEKLAHRRA
jgi:glycosyltransferase involved in cell wall biosynthesis